MMNDHDFVERSINNCGVNAPKYMDEAYVLEKLADTQPKVVALPKKRSYGRIAAVAAVFVFVAAIGAAVGVHFANRKAVIPEVTKETGLIQFTDHAQVRAAMKEIGDRIQRTNTLYYGVEDEAAEMITADGAKAADVNGSSAMPSYQASDTGATGSASHSDTYKQVEGVDEADIIKTDGRYIYAVEHTFSYDDNYYQNDVAVFEAVAGVTDPIFRIVPGEDYSSATADEAIRDENKNYVDNWRYISDIFIRDTRLIMIVDDDRTWEERGEYKYEQMTRAYVYDISDMDSVRLLDSYSQSGFYTSSRMIGDNLYLISNEYSDGEIPVCGNTYDEGYIPADCIYSIEKPSAESFLIVSAFNTLDSSYSADTKAILGVGSEIYCNEDNLYITAADYSYQTYSDEDYAVDVAVDVAEKSYIAYSRSAVTTKIFKVSLSGGVSFTAYGEVDGYINNNYSLDEFNGYLRVAATTTNDDYEDTNSLYVLDSDLDIVGSVTGFAETESIKAVRYVGDTAYVITYERTDPLFVIDLSDPTAPEILGEVKISGFSTMLVPIDGDTVLGLGVSTSDADYTDMEVTDGFKLALFDVSDKSSPKVLDSRVYEYCYSAVTYNPKALVYNAERGDFVIPLNYAYYNYDESTGVYTDEQYGGMLNFTVEGGRIVETDRYTSSLRHFDRCVYVGDTVYMTYNNDEGYVYLESVSYR